MTGTYEIITDGFITQPYALRYLWKPIEGQNTQRQIDGNKVGMLVTISADGKPSKTFYHEVENIEYEGQLIDNRLDGFPDAATIDHYYKKCLTNMLIHKLCHDL